jgi:hypothetical protein
VVAGLVYALASRSAASTANNLRSGHSDSYCSDNPTASCAQLASETHSQQTDYVASEVLYSVGGALAVAAVGTWLFWPKGSMDARAVTFAPTVLDRGAALTVGGAFF